MTARTCKTLCSLAMAMVTVSCAGYYEIPIETPIRPKLDVSAFQRVLVAGFIAGGIATLALGLIVIFPLIGYASWHAYEEIVSETE